MSTTLTKGHYSVALKMPDAAFVEAMGLGENEFVAIISSPTEDRDGETIVGRAFEPLPDRIPIEIDHAHFVGGSGVKSIVGSGTPFYVGDVLMIRGEFASTETAQEVRTLALEGHLSAMSIAFGRDESTATRSADGRITTRNGELFNVSFVGVGANPDAHVLVAKGAELDEGGPAAVVVLERPEGVSDDDADAWSAAVEAFSAKWVAPEAENVGDDEADETDVDVATSTDDGDNEVANEETDPADTEAATAATDDGLAKSLALSRAVALLARHELKESTP